VDIKWRKQDRNVKPHINHDFSTQKRQRSACKKKFRAGAKRKEKSAQAKAVMLWYAGHILTGLSAMDIFFPGYFIAVVAICTGQMLTSLSRPMDRWNDHTLHSLTGDFLWYGGHIVTSLSILDIFFPGHNFQIVFIVSGQLMTMFSRLSERLFHASLYRIGDEMWYVGHITTSLVILADYGMEEYVPIVIPLGQTLVMVSRPIGNWCRRKQADVVPV